MLAKGAAKKVTIWVNEDTRAHAGLLYEAVLQYLLHRGVAGATASRALAGFGAHHRVHTANIEVLAEHLPIRIEFIETAARVEELLPTLYDMVSDGLIEVQDTTVVKAVNRERPEAPRTRQVRTAPAKLMRIFLGESDRWQDEPLYGAIVKRLRMLEIAGATVYRGIEGYGAKGHTHKDRFLHLSRDLPVMISVVDAEARLRAAIPAIEEMMIDGLIVISDVEMIRLEHEHEHIAG